MTANDAYSVKGREWAATCQLYPAIRFLLCRSFPGWLGENDFGDVRAGLGLDGDGVDSAPLA